MSQQSHAPGRVPAGNRPHSGADYEPPEPDQDESGKTDAPQDEPSLDQQQDEKRRLGQFTGQGEPPRQGKHRGGLPMDATKRGEQDRKKEMEEFEGEPLNERREQVVGSKPSTVTRDKGVEPSNDVRREGNGVEEGG
jgi:hypothetical protein